MPIHCGLCNELRQGQDITASPVKTGSDQLCHGGLFAAPSGLSKMSGDVDSGRRTANFKDRLVTHSPFATYMPFVIEAEVQKPWVSLGAYNFSAWISQIAE